MYGDYHNDLRTKRSKICSFIDNSIEYWGNFSAYYKLNASYVTKE